MDFSRFKLFYALGQHVEWGTGLVETFKQPRPPLRMLTMAINFSNAFGMVNLTKLIATLILSPLTH